jgi:2'-5' RNA ligase
MPRLFVAIDLPASTSQRLAALNDADLTVRWTPVHQYHLTLRFIGDVEDTTAQALTDSLATIPPPRLSLDGTGLGVFPSQRKPRVLFANVEPTPLLMALQEQIETAVQRSGLAPAPRPFHPHITLGRVKGATPGAVRRYRQQHENFQLGPVEAGSFVLYESRLSPTGAEHLPVATYSHTDAAT